MSIRSDGDRALSVALIDNYDSFTHNIRHALVLSGVACTLFPHDRITADELLAQPFHGFVVSAGPCQPDRSGVSLALVRRHLERDERRPLLGICLGHQVLAAVHGGRLRRAERALHGKRCRLHHDGRGLFEGLPNPFEAARYNSLTVVPEDLPAALEVSAHDDAGEIMALRDKSGPRLGVQFHPESWLSQAGAALFANWTAMLRAQAPTGPLKAR